MQISDTDKESKSLKRECKQLRNLNSNLQFELTSAQERLQHVEQQLEQKNEKVCLYLIFFRIFMINYQK